ncbi:MAG TPA: hypothetical protein VFH42_07345, partial [Sporolactobacillaceae bacterium]|nr:hypothetical protein [Sporolactobacillaceae bacterium]
AFSELKTDVERLSALFYGLNPELDEAFLRGYRFSNKERKAILERLYLLNLNEEVTPYLLYKWGIDCLSSVERLKKVLGRTSALSELDRMWRQLPIRSSQELEVRGNDLLSWTGERGGPWVKSLLTTIEENVVNGNLTNNTEAIRKWVELEWMKKKNRF